MGRSWAEENLNHNGPAQVSAPERGLTTVCPRERRATMAILNSIRTEWLGWTRRPADALLTYPHAAHFGHPSHGGRDSLTPETRDPFLVALVAPTRPGPFSIVNKKATDIFSGRVLANELTVRIAVLACMHSHGSRTRPQQPALFLSFLQTFSLAAEI